MDYHEFIRKLKVEIDFREPYIEFKKDMIKNWEVPFHNQKLTYIDKERIYKRIKDFLLESFPSKILYLDD